MELKLNCFFFTEIIHSKDKANYIICKSSLVLLFIDLLSVFYWICVVSCSNTLPVKVHYFLAFLWSENALYAYINIATCTHAVKLISELIIFIGFEDYSVYSCYIVFFILSVNNLNCIEILNQSLYG